MEIDLTIANFANPTGSNNFKTYLTKSVSSSIVYDPPQTVEIFIAINSLNSHKACGFGSISVAFLHLRDEVLAPVVSYYFSCAFGLEVFPNYFKTAKVIPIFKSGNKNLLSNYRPISPLTTISKVLEKLIKGDLLKFFDKHNILYEHQYGFREKHSFSHAFLDVSSLCYDSIQNKPHAAMLFMDQRKAFDTVLHKILHNMLTITEFEALR